MAAISYLMILIQFDLLSESIMKSNGTLARFKENNYTQNFSEALRAWEQQ